jgi:hypothetical protein
VDSSSTKNEEHHEIEFRHASQLSKWSGRHMPLSAFSSDIFFPLSVTRSVNYSPARCTSTAAELMLIMICQIWLLTGRVDLISPLPLLLPVHVVSSLSSRPRRVQFSAESWIDGGEEERTTHGQTARGSRLAGRSTGPISGVGRLSACTRSDTLFPTTSCSTWGYS